VTETSSTRAICANHKCSPVTVKTGRAYIGVPPESLAIFPCTLQVSMMDYVVSSYTPTITALLRAQRDVKYLERDNVSLALVAEKRALQRNLETIPGVDEEIQQIAAVVKSNNAKVICHQTGSTTVAHTAAVMQAANILHLACHGIQDGNDATQSGFCLGDGRLTISKLMELKLDGAFLAFLSACETAKGDKEQPDQAMHLAAAMLFSGFKSVIATMW
jgi:CHAT domain-containing protein